MRKFSLFLLLATVAAPALAAAGEDNDRAERRAKRAEASEQSDKPQRAERVEQADKPQPAERAERRQRSSASEEPANVRVRESRGGGENGAAVTSQAQDQDTVRTWRRAQRNTDRNREIVKESGQQAGGALAPRQRRIRTIPDTQPTATRPATIEPPASVTRQRRDYRDGNYNRWTRNWHRDSRYDWRRWRDRNRSRFHLGFYFDPFGWSYRRWSFGSYLWPSYYSSRYWLNDPWEYRLPPAYGPYRWVRYWDDALLVNIYTGEVVDVIHNFFW